MKSNLFKAILLIFLLFTIIYIVYLLKNDFKKNELFTVIYSDINGKNYKVRTGYSEVDSVKAANYLANISLRIDKLVDYMTRNNLPNKEISDRLNKRWNKCNLNETAHNENTAAYTVNKSEEIRLCVRNENGLENMNTSMFVILHELGHMMSISYGHNEEFRTNFDYIVHLASNLGVYEPQDFTTNPVNYCGNVIQINTSPCSKNMCEYTTIPFE